MFLQTSNNNHSIQSIWAERVLLKPGELKQNIRFILNDGKIQDILLNQQPHIHDFILPNTTLIPGLINSHAHLELTHLYQQIPRRLSFPDWVQILQQKTASWTHRNFIQSFETGIEQVIQSGTTTLADTGNYLPRLQSFSIKKIRLLAFQEIFGLDPEKANTLEQANSENYSVSSIQTPHAVYSCSPQLLKKIFTHKSQVQSIHLDESQEEQQLLQKGTGSLRTFIDEKFANHHLQCGGLNNSFEYLAKNHLLKTHSIFVHGNHLQMSQWDSILKNECSIVHCPSSHDFFGHRSFPAKQILQAGINLCLGTDSLASAYSLNLLEELSRISRDNPSLTPDDLITLVTINGAKALGLESVCGTLEVNKSADFVFLDSSTNSLHPFQNIEKKIPKVKAVFSKGIRIF